MSDRRRWTAKEKLEIVLEGLRGDREVAAVCRRHGISPTQFYEWKDKLLKSADAVFQHENGKRDREKDRLKEKVSRLESVVAEITTENLELKKKSGR